MTENNLDDAIDALRGAEKMKAEEIEAADAIEEGQEEEGSSVLTDEQIEASQGSSVVPDDEEPIDPEDREAAPVEEAAEELPVEDGEEVDATPETLSMAEYQRMKRETFATQSELKRIRGLRRTDTERIKNLETITQDVAGQLREAQATEIPQEVLDDPLYKRIDERFNTIEDRINPKTEKAPPGQLTRHQAQLAARYLREAGAEMRANMPAGHFDSAYAHARKVYMEKNGITDPAQMNAVEIRMAIELGAEGRSPAVESVRFAEANDWKPPVNGSEPAAVVEEKPGIPEVSDTKVRRLRQGVDGNAASSTGASPQGRTAAMGVQKFYDTFDAGERMVIFQRHPEAFEHMAKHYEMPSKYLPS